MGIAILAIYLPLLMLACVIAIALSLAPIRRSREKQLPSYQIASGYAVGGILALFITTAYAWWYATNTTNEWGSLIGPLAISLAGPLAVGLFFLLLWLVLRNRFSSLGYAVAGALHATIAMPIVGILMFYLYDPIVNEPVFDSLCANAGVVVLEKVEPASSAAVVFSAFLRSNNSGMGRESVRSLYALLDVPQTSLKYLDVRIPDSNGHERYFRVSGRLEPIEAPNAQYEISSSRLDIPDRVSRRMHGQRIEVQRSSDKKLISYVEYYWDSDRGWECPVGISKQEFFVNFVAASLSVPAPSN